VLHTVAVSGYRSLRDLVLPLGRLSVVTGGNGTGKSSLYRSLRLLADVGQGRVVGSLAREGGLQSVLWAGPESLDGARRRGQPVQGVVRKGPVSLRLGFAGDDFGYLIDLGFPKPSSSVFDRDPEIKREVVFSGDVMRQATTLARRKGPTASTLAQEGWRELTSTLPTHRSMLTELADPVQAPELLVVREQIRAWRFYDGFRVDAHSPARLPQVGTRTSSLADDGSDLAAAVQTILEQGPGDLEAAVADAFDGARVRVDVADGVFTLLLEQAGMLRPLRAAELSDGTLRYLLWAAALLGRDRPPLVVLNEPETSLHPELLPPLGRLIARASHDTQVVVVTHSRLLVDHLEVKRVAPGEPTPDRVELPLAKDLGETVVPGWGLLAAPSWHWGSR
jgi:predicted ATPase